MCSIHTFTTSHLMWISLFFAFLLLEHLHLVDGLTMRLETSMFYISSQPSESSFYLMIASSIFFQRLTTMRSILSLLLWADIVDPSPLACHPGVLQQPAGLQWDLNDTQMSFGGLLGCVWYVGLDGTTWDNFLLSHVWRAISMGWDGTGRDKVGQKPQKLVPPQTLGQTCPMHGTSVKKTFLPTKLPKIAKISTIK